MMIAEAAPVNAQVRLRTVVELQHQGTADTAERVSSEPLVEAGGNALLCGDVLQEIISVLVDVLNNWLFCLHLESHVCLCCRKRGGE